MLTKILKVLLVIGVIWLMLLHLVPLWMALIFILFFPYPFSLNFILFLVGLAVVLFSLYLCFSILINFKKGSNYFLKDGLKYFLSQIILFLSIWFFSYLIEKAGNEIKTEMTGLEMEATVNSNFISLLEPGSFTKSSIIPILLFMGFLWLHFKEKNDLKKK